MDQTFLQRVEMELGYAAGALRNCRCLKELFLQVYEHAGKEGLIHVLKMREAELEFPNQETTKVEIPSSLWEALHATADEAGT